MNNTPQEYRDAYREFLQDNNLHDDSKTISEVDLIEYLNSELDEEQREMYGIDPDSVITRYCILRDVESVTNINGTEIEIKGVPLDYIEVLNTGHFYILHDGKQYDECRTAFNFYNFN